MEGSQHSVSGLPSAAREKATKRHISAMHLSTDLGRLTR